MHPRNTSGAVVLADSRRIWRGDESEASSVCNWKLSRTPARIQSSSGYVCSVAKSVTSQKFVIKKSCAFVEGSVSCS
jgi:hypothetical protein